MNSRKMAPSTGKFPPVPSPIIATITAVPIKFGPPPAAVPNMPAMKSVKLNANCRPIKSAPIPQNAAPIIKPTYTANVKNV